MLRQISITLLSSLLLLTAVKQALADTVLESIARSGKLVVGTSFDAVPYSYYNQNNELDGYAIDTVKLIQQQLEKELSKSIELELVEADNIADTIPKLLNGEIDIACNAVFTWERDQYVDYTIRYSQSGIRMLIPSTANITATDTLKGKKIGLADLTFVNDAMKLAYPEATLIPLKSVPEAIDALKSGKVEALAGDSLLLDGLRQEINPNGYKLYPPLSEKPYAQYGIACILPENNSTFLNIANYAIAKMMQGYLIGDPESVTMVDKWIGPDGVIKIVDTENIKQFYESTIKNHEQIPFPQQ